MDDRMKDLKKTQLLGSVIHTTKEQSPGPGWARIVDFATGFAGGRKLILSVITFGPLSCHLLTCRKICLKRMINVMADSMTSVLLG